MKKNIILAGVGGQGILSIAYVIDNAALDRGYHFKQAEVHGMAQRGGAVQSNLRYADEPLHSDVIPSGTVDLIVSVEPLEVKRYWHFLNPNGWVVSSVTPYINIPDYPGVEELLPELAEFPNIVLVDSATLAKAAGNLRAQNMVVVGAASTHLDFTPEELLKHVEGLFKRKGEKIVEVNRRAFALGRAAGLMFRGLIDAGMKPLDALRLSRSFDPVTLDPAFAPLWAAALANEDERLDAMIEEGPIDCSNPPKGN